MDTCFSCPRGGTGAATAGHERLARIKPGEWHQVARRSSWPPRALFLVPGGRQDVRLGRSMVFRPEWPAEAPRSVRGQPTYPQSGCE